MYILGAKGISMIKWAFILNLFIVSTITTPQDRLLTSLKPSNVIFLWDLHDVLLQKNTRKMLQTFWQYENKKQLFSHLNFALIKKLFSQLRRLATSGGTGEEFIQLTKENNNPYLAEIILRMVNIQYPIQGSLAILQSLHEQGYTHYIGSNIGETAFNDIINAKKHPHLADLFSFFNLAHPQVVYYHSDPTKIIKKPDVQFFLSFIKNNHIDLDNVSVIFIDDCYDNIRAAKKVGFIAIHFKNPAQLKRALEKLGFNFQKNLKVPQKVIGRI